MEYSKVQLLMPMDGVNNGTTFTEFSPARKGITVGGNAKTSTAQSKYYGASTFFDGTGDYLIASAAPGQLNLGTNDFTIALWFNDTSVTTAFRSIVAIGLLTMVDGNDLSIDFRTNAAGNLDAAAYSGTTNVTPTLIGSIPTKNVFNHIAITRKGNTFYLFLNGVLQGTVVSSASLNSNNAAVVNIGRRDINIPREVTGYIQDLVIINGQALWSANFTPPTQLIGSIAGNVTEGTYSYISKWLVRNSPMISATGGNTDTTVTGATYAVKGIIGIPYQLSCAPYIDASWEANLPVTLGQFVIASNPEVTPYLWEVTTAGTFGGTETVWNLSGTTTQGTAVLTFVGTLPNPSILGPKLPS